MPKTSLREKTTVAQQKAAPVKPHKIGIFESVASFFTNNVLKPVVAVAFAAIAVITLGNVDLNAQTARKTGEYSLAAGINPGANKLGDETKARGYAVKGTPVYDVAYADGVLTFKNLAGLTEYPLPLNLCGSDIKSIANTPLRLLWHTQYNGINGIFLGYDYGMLFVSLKVTSNGHVDFSVHIVKQKDISLNTSGS